MRYALRPQDTNVQPPKAGGELKGEVKGEQQQQQQQHRGELKGGEPKPIIYNNDTAIYDQENAARKRLTKPSRKTEPAAADNNDSLRDSLREWRQRWRQIMRDAVIYFDGISPNQVDRLRSYLNVLGSQVQPFFDQKVTHVISENASTSDVALKARDAHRKVYTVEKLARFLSSLLGHSVNTALDASQSAKLARMLEEDSRMTTHAAAQSARKEDFYYFRGPYLLVWDPSRYNRPMCIKEWKPSVNAEEGEWPQLRRAPMGMSPFTARAIVRSEKRKYHHQQQQLEEQQQQQQQEQQQPPQEQQPEESEEEESEEEESEDEVKKRATIYEEPELKDKENIAPMLERQARQAPQPAHTTNSTRLREFGEIVASGVPRYSQTSANLVPTQKDASREIVKLRRKVMPRAATTEIPTVQPSVRVNSVTAPVPPPAPAATTPSLAIKQRPQAVPRTKTKKPGYCENCLEKYDDLAEHLASKRHRMFAANEQKFHELDLVIATLQRR